MEYEFTSESVSIGHPDKVADLISDSVANFLLSKNISHRAAIETLVTTNMVTIAGEYKSNNFDKDEIEKREFPTDDYSYDMGNNINDSLKEWKKEIKKILS